MITILVLLSLFFLQNQLHKKIFKLTISYINVEIGTCPMMANQNYGCYSQLSAVLAKVLWEIEIYKF